MKHFHTVVLERMNWFTADFNTEPYEAAWASEAIFFIRVLDCPQESWCLNSAVQIAVDGIDWVDDQARFDPVTETGTYVLKVTHFGGWLRLRSTLVGADPGVRLTIHLVLKE